MNFYSLGIVLFLGHDGVPCPLTVEVCLYWHLYWHHQFCSVMTLYITIRARRWSSWASCPESWVHPSHFPCGPWPLPPPLLHNSKDIQGLSTTLFEPLMVHPTKRSHHVCTAKLGNPHITVVHNSGIFDMEILYCICTNAVEKDESWWMLGSFLQASSISTFIVLNDFLMDNLECKTTAQQYYSKLQSITNRMFPDSVPVSWNSFTTLSLIPWLLDTGSIQAVSQSVSPMEGIAQYL